MISRTIAASAIAISIAVTSPPAASAASASPVADSVPAASTLLVTLRDAATVRVHITVGSYSGSTWGKGARYPGPCRVKVRDDRKKKMLLSARMTESSQTFTMKRASLRKGRYSVSASITCPKRVVKVTDDGPAYRVRFTKVAGKTSTLERANGYSFAYLD